MFEFAAVLIGFGVLLAGAGVSSWGRARFSEAEERVRLAKAIGEWK